jgi:hypothetical protein
MTRWRACLPDDVEAFSSEFAAALSLPSPEQLVSITPTTL